MPTTLTGVCWASMTSVYAGDEAEAAAAADGVRRAEFHGIG